MTRLLSSAEVIGITGDEPPLTPDDVTVIARRFYTPATAAAALTGDRQTGRPSCQGGGGGGLFYNCDRRGIWAHIGDPRRAGHIPWRDLEAVLRRNATATTVRALVDADAAHRAHVVEHAQAWVEWQYGPGRGTGPRPVYDFATGARLQAAAYRALNDLLDGQGAQDALFTIEAPS